jgi:hypothetical protein
MQDVVVCIGDPGESITFAGVGGTAPYTFSYTINGGPTQTISTSVGNSATLIPPTNVSGSFIYLLTQITDNIGSTQSLNDNVFVTINPLPIVNAGPEQSVCPGTQVTLMGTGATTYTWDNGVINGIAFMPTATMVYTVTGTDLNGCINTDQVTVHVECAAINETVMNNIDISPNPANSFVNIESEIVMNDISIFSVNGQFIKQLSPMSQKSIIDLSDLKAGIYFLKINSEIGSNTKRILKE